MIDVNGTTEEISAAVTTTWWIQLSAAAPVLDMELGLVGGGDGGCG
jgi:hypothetical protein